MISHVICILATHNPSLMLPSGWTHWHHFTDISLAVVALSYKFAPLALRNIYLVSRLLWDWQLDTLSVCGLEVSGEEFYITDFDIYLWGCCSLCYVVVPCIAASVLPRVTWAGVLMAAAGARLLLPRRLHHLLNCHLLLVFFTLDGIVYLFPEFTNNSSVKRSYSIGILLKSAVWICACGLLEWTVDVHKEDKALLASLSYSCLTGRHEMLLADVMYWNLLKWDLTKFTIVKSHFRVADFFHYS